MDAAPPSTQVTLAIRSCGRRSKQLKERFLSTHSKRRLAPSFLVKNIHSELGQISPFFETFADLMARHPKVPPPVLGSEELHVLAAQMKDACAFLAEIGLPDALAHMDFNPGNIIGSPNGCVFLDWAEAYVGHPIFTFEYLREHLFRSHSDENAWQSTVTSRYLEPWISLASIDQASRALEITPLVAVFAYAMKERRERCLN
jgi:thiamine kinase-like enzyme